MRETFGLCEFALCESLYKALRADGNPEFATVLKVVEALGLRLTAASGQSRGARTPRRAA
jgi:hypothetical protein